MSEPKLIVTVKFCEGGLHTENVYDTRTKELWSKEHIHERGIELFINKEDLKESLNWNTNGDGDKYEWHGVGKDYLVALVYD